MSIPAIDQHVGLATSETIDPLSFGVLNNYVGAIVDEMTITVLRTAYSPSVRDIMDFSPAICGADGQLVAQGLGNPSHMGSIPEAIQHIRRRYADSVEPGDVYIMNDPYEGGMHLPDVFIFKPVFVGDELLAYMSVVAHQIDIGGRVAGSSAPDSTEIFQEGLRIPPLKLFDRGVRNDAVWELIACNVRQPTAVHGDLRSQLSACTVAERKLLEIVDKHGINALRRYFSASLDYAERLARAEIAAMPDGTYTFTDYLDDDGISDEPIRIQVAITIAGDEMLIDLTGTSPQVRGALNCTPSFTKSSAYAAVRAVFTVDLPNNAGYMRPIRFILPEGSVVWPNFPAAVAARGATGKRVTDAMMGALAQAVPGHVLAAGEGGTSSFRLGGRDERGRPWVLMDTIMGTWGARPDRDGIDGLSNFASNLSNLPAEVAEAQFPVRCHQYALRQDSGGPGKFRGGLGIVREWELLGSECVCTSRTDRRKFPPYGILGGLPGAPSLTHLNPGQENRLLPTKFTRSLEQNDVLLHLQAAGGGYGDPLERDPERVLFDYLEGKVSAAHARQAYGVVVDEANQQIDAQATAELRKTRLESATRAPEPPVNGHTREDARADIRTAG
jgi:N-methylhydantoinase B